MPEAHPVCLCAIDTFAVFALVWLCVSCGRILPGESVGQGLLDGLPKRVRTIGCGSAGTVGSESESMIL